VGPGLEEGEYSSFKLSAKVKRLLVCIE